MYTQEAQAQDAIDCAPSHAAPGAIFGIREAGEGVLVLRARSEQLAMQPRKGFGRAVIRTQPENQFTAHCDEADCLSVIAGKK